MTPSLTLRPEEDLPSDGFWWHRGSGCDVTERRIVSRCPWLLKSGCPDPPCWFVPAFQPSSWRSWSVWSALVLVSWLGSRSLQLSRPDPEPSKGFPRPCQLQAAGTLGRRARSSRGELCADTPPRGAESPFLPPLPGHANDHGLSSFPSVTPAAAPPNRGSTLPSPAPPSPPPRAQSMDRELDNRCPVCLDSWEDAAYAMPCLHQFCFQCIRRWANSKPECPLCKGRVHSIIHSVRANNDFEEVAITPSALASASGSTRQAGGAPTPPATHRPPRHPATPQPPAAESGTRPPVGGLQPDTWASLFDDHPALLQRFLPWLQQQLRLTFVEEPSTAVVLQDLILSVLGLVGLDEDVLVRLLQPCLHHRAATFARQLIQVAVQRCSREAHRLLGLADGHAAEEREATPTALPQPPASQRGSPDPAPATHSSPQAAHEDGRLHTSTADLRGGPHSTPDSPVPRHREQEELHQHSGEAVAGPSAPSPGGHRSSQGTRRAPKRKASSSHGSSQPSKRPPRRQN